MSWSAILILIVIILLAIYTLVPEFLFHILGIGCWKRHYGSGVSITFDDGPNPEITPQILEILARHQLKATFFVVGDKAENYPELISNILEQKHNIGAHSQHHRHAWTMSPWATWREWNQSVTTLEGLTGQEVEWVRPPWGAFNLASWCWMKMHKKRIVLWNAEGHDWKARQTPEAITARLIRKVDDGSIILLHDAGGDQGAPSNTLKALDQLCRKIVEDKKLPLKTLEFPEWSIWRRLSFQIWEKWERLFTRLYHVQRIDAFNVFRIAQTIYKGPPLYDREGQLLARSGDVIGEFHLDNIRIQSRSSNANLIAVQALRRVRESLPDVARFVANDPSYQKINLFLSVTVLFQGVERLGFQVQDVPASWANTFIGLLQGTVGRVYRPWDKTKKKAKRRTDTKLAWITRQALLDWWLSKDQ